jgi:addiction module HigA family antidote
MANLFYLERRRRVQRGNCGLSPGDKMTKKLYPIHPGEILLEEFLSPLGISQYRLAKEISVPARRINEIVLGKRAITPDTALRLSLFFGLSERFWMNLQTRYDIEVEKDRLKQACKRSTYLRCCVNHQQSWRRNSRLFV